MDNQTGIAILSSVLNSLSYKVNVSSPEQKNPNSITNISLQKMLLKGCYKTDHYETQELGCKNSTDDRDTSTEITIIVETFEGKEIPHRVIPTEKIMELKKHLFKTKGFPVEDQCLIFAGEQLVDENSYEYYNVNDDSVIHLLLKVKGKDVFDLPSDFIDQSYSKDLTNVSDTGASFYRGGVPYSRPCGWTCFGLKVQDTYVDKVWLDGRSPRADQYSSAEGEWLVSYHGTSYNNGLCIADEGYHLSEGKRFEFGNGIYSTPDIEIASKYSMPEEVNGKRYQIVMQNRVNPENMKIISKAETGVGEYWISPRDVDIRPYGFCFREC